MERNYTLSFQGVQTTTGFYSKQTTVETKKVYVLFIGKPGDIVSELENADFLVHILPTAKEAIKWIKEKKFRYSPLPNALVYVADERHASDNDISRLKSTVHVKDIPLIYYSTEFSEVNRKKAITAQAEDYVVSSAGWEELANRIEFLTKLKELNSDQDEEVGISPVPTGYNAETFKMWSLKRAFDIVVSSLALLILSPIMLLVALMVKLDSPGPIFYVSKRAGKGYQIFNFYKFRSMRLNAEYELDRMHHLNEYGNHDQLFFKVKNDPRITRLGSFLRKTSLDELPQFFNVLKGDMSLVGNRPLPLYEAEKLTQDQWALRFLAPAGITGLWQVLKHKTTNMSIEERVALDMKYARENSFLYDMKIMLKTPLVLIQREKY
jgi:lipopolysaccharide/colanic/teichoic acid biosynthesis glycosyltransferase